MDTSSLTDFRIMVVDDCVDIGLIAKLIIEMRGPIVRPYASPLHALSEFDEFQPHLIISDISMPEMNGYEFLKEIRRHEAEHGRHPTPAIAITGHAGFVDQMSSLSAGYLAHYDKPVDFDELLTDVLGRLPANAAGE